MATQLQLRSGTTLQNNIFTGAPGELTYDTEKKNIRIHDGTTEGGMVVASQGTADFVIAWQMPTADNNYTWYRKYASGWVEQGGRVQAPSGTIVLSVPMADTNYSIIGNIANSDQDNVVYTFQPRTPTTDTIPYYCAFASSTSAGGANEQFYWQVSGLAAQGV